MASFIFPVPLQVPGCRPQQVKALPADWQAACLAHSCEHTAMLFCETWAGNELASELRLLFLAWLIPVSTQQCFVMKPGQEMNGLKTNAIWALVMQ